MSQEMIVGVTYYLDVDLYITMLKCHGHFRKRLINCLLITPKVTWSASTKKRKWKVQEVLYSSEENNISTIQLLLNKASDKCWCYCGIKPKYMYQDVMSTKSEREMKEKRPFSSCR